MTNDSFVTMANQGTYPHTIVIGGPTSSGKSALALSLAQRVNGVLINADSMQLYREIPILSGQPSAAEQSLASHELYGVMSIAQQSSAASWQKLASAKIADVIAQGKLPILVGGTGLYFQALMEGLSDIPDVDPAIRAQVQQILDSDGVEGLRRELLSRDPVMAARLKPNDRQRTARALEVILQTGQSLASFQGNRAPDEGGRQYRLITLLPPRAEVYARCEKRFDMMLDTGALDEVRAIESMPDLPNNTALKAKGIPELRAFLRGEMARDDAVAMAKTKTRQYAKRQYTWFRNQMNPDIMIDVVIHDGNADRYAAQIGQEIK